MQTGLGAKWDAHVPLLLCKRLFQLQVSPLWAFTSSRMSFTGCTLYFHRSHLPGWSAAQIVGFHLWAGTTGGVKTLFGVFEQRHRGIQEAAGHVDALLWLLPSPHHVGSSWMGIPGFVTWSCCVPSGSREAFKVLCFFMKISRHGKAASFWGWFLKNKRLQNNFFPSAMCCLQLVPKLGRRGKRNNTKDGKGGGELPLLVTRDNSLLLNEAKIFLGMEKGFLSLKHWLCLYLSLSYHLLLGSAISQNP